MITVWPSGGKRGALSIEMYNNSCHISSSDYSPWYYILDNCLWEFISRIIFNIFLICLSPKSTFLCTELSLCDHIKHWLLFGLLFKWLNLIPGFWFLTNWNNVLDWWIITLVPMLWSCQLISNVNVRRSIIIFYIALSSKAPRFPQLSNKDKYSSPFSVFSLSLQMYIIIQALPKSLIDKCCPSLRNSEKVTSQYCPNKICLRKCFSNDIHSFREIPAIRSGDYNKD